MPRSKRFTKNFPRYIGDLRGLINLGDLRGPGCLRDIGGFGDLGSLGVSKKKKYSSFDMTECQCNVSESGHCY